ncbi:MAG: hypothetical protein PHV99_00510 [Candidatus Pacebacteria bacterium]|nr:hypothetical protein [Candidatus Paceibacterota bacterium]
MEKFRLFLQLLLTWQVLLGFVVAIVIEVLFCAATDIWRKPSGFKTSMLGSIMFTIGVTTMFFAK